MLASKYFNLFTYSEEDIPKNFEKEYSLRGGEREENQNRNLNPASLHNSLQSSNNKNYNFKNPMHQTSYEKNLPEGANSHNYSYNPYPNEYYHTQQNNKKIFLEPNQEQKGGSNKRQGRPPMPERKNNSRQNLPNNSGYNRNTSTSAERVDKRMSPYFKNMAKEYNPKYREKSNEKFNRLKSELEMKMREECSFTPKLSEYARNLEAKPESKEEKIKRLSTPKIVEVQKRQKMKEEIENHNVTLIPNI